MPGHQDIDPALYPWQSAHQAEIEAYFGDRLLRPLEPAEQALLGDLQLCLVAFTNRSGSNLLCSLLNRAGLGIPEASEPLNRTTLLPLAREHGIATFTDYLLGYLRGWQVNGTAGLKIGPQQLFWLQRTGLLQHCRRLVVIDCQRRDRLDQAISHCIARASGQWHSNMPAGDKAIEYSSGEILRSLADIGQGRELIERYLAIHQPPRLPLYYEEVMADPAVAVDAVSGFLGIPLSAANSGLQKQGGELNREFRRRFLSEFAAG